ncbi:acyl-CoA dehydrogenase family protein [Agromyces larvae]|uniref:Acyl-CoA dehydrogenase family protein n=1 Tax=Agromyces larvae TaxID=2929802 RepID=A0ABY4C2H2_9MICO|nr:acyl-CoA dehydrogenase family protein [Agromyces larvae]UOE44173.1 acyl-CoA dehydrogenase family protein [Agromyces larvae]
MTLADSRTEASARPAPPAPFYGEDHEAYRETVREFLRREVVPNFDRWEEERLIPRSVWKAAAEAGLYSLAIPEEYGGPGEPDYRFRMVVCEEVARTNTTSFGVGIGLQDDIITPYFLHVGNDEQRQRFLPGLASGELIGAIGMTEPGTGSDLQGIRTTAVRDGDDWILNGQKTFISSGIQADFVIAVARTDPDAGSKGFSLFIVETGMPGFERGRKLDKVGIVGQDTAELFFRDVRVPAANLVGEVGGGMAYLMQNLPLERLGIAIASQAGAEAALAWTLDYVYERRAFGQRIGDFQNTRFELAEIETEVEVARAFVEQAVLKYNAGVLSTVEASKAKWYVSELQQRVVYRCQQLFGGYGFMLEYPIGKAYRDARIQTIYGGTTEIMKEIIGRAQAARYRG